MKDSDWKIDREAMCRFAKSQPRIKLCRGSIPLSSATERNLKMKYFYGEKTCSFEQFGICWELDMNYWEVLKLLSEGIKVEIQ